MIVAFVAIFAVAFTFTVLSFIFIENDTKERSYRPIYLLSIAIAAWLSTIFILTVPAAATTISPAYNIIVSNGGANTIVYIPATTSVVNNDMPFPAYGFYIYMGFAGAMATIEIIFLALFMLQMSVKTLEDGMKGLR